MSKKNEYRFNLRFDETDEDHRKVCQFLNDYCGSRKKARYIVKAVLAYWKLENKSIELTSKPQVISALPKEQSVPLAVEEENNKEEHFVSIDGDYEADEAEVSLMLKNYQMFNNSEE